MMYVSLISQYPDSVSHFASRPSRLVTETIVVETQAHAGRTKSKAQAVTAQSWFVFRKTGDDLNHSDSMELGK